LSNLLKIWLIAVIFVLLGTIVKSIASYTYTTELTLEKETTIDVSLFRFLSGNIGMSLIFKNRDTQTLGNYRYKNTFKEDGYLTFINPGEPIILSIKDTMQSILYEAKPASSGTERTMVPYENDNNPSRFSYPRSQAMYFIANAGLSKFTVKVINVGKNLEGENVILKISPAMLGFKFMSLKPLYAFLWFFNLWPLWFLLLFISYKYIKKTLPNNQTTSSNFVHIIDHSVYHIVLNPALSFFIMLFLSHAAPLLAFLSIVIIYFITVPLFLQKKYPLYNNFQKSFSWFTWIVSAIFIFFFLLKGFYRYII